MYERFFGLQRHPFTMTPDPGVLFLTSQHKEALVGLTYAILARKGFVVLSGDAGTGKTTILARLLEYLPSQRICTSVILNPTLTPTEFMELAMLDFGMTDIPQSKAQRIYRFQQFLVENYAAGKISALVVDEAHKLSPEVLEEIRLLSNFENAEHKLIQIVLLGQSELTDILNREDLRQLKQRIVVRLKLERLSAPDIAEYIQYRWDKAGSATPAPFPVDVVEKIANLSRGIPRLINAICDNALMLAFATSQSVVSAEHVQEAARDLELLEKKEPKAPAVLAAAPVAAEVATVSPAIVPLQSFERYGGAEDIRPSFWSRWIGKLGLA
jgi:general secretion pathway protein A